MSQCAASGPVNTPTSRSARARLKIKLLDGELLMFLNGSSKMEARTRQFPITVTGENSNIAIPIVQAISGKSLPRCFIASSMISASGIVRIFVVLKISGIFSCRLVNL